MKFSTAIILLALGLIAYAVFSGGRSRPADAPSSPSLFSSALAIFKSGASALSGKHTTWEKSELFICRGTVIDRLPLALVVDCASPSIPHSIDYYGHISASINQPLPMGEASNREELQLYGPLTVVERGNARPSPFDPGVWDTNKYLHGTVILTDYPLALVGSNRNIKVVVAPDSASSYQNRSLPAYSAAFALAGGTPTPSSDWMWKDRGALDKK